MSDFFRRLLDDHHDDHHHEHHNSHHGDHDNHHDRHYDYYEEPRPYRYEEPRVTPVPSRMIICGRCGVSNDASYKFCYECGGKLEKAPSACPNCNTPRVRNAKFCQQCGTKMG